MRIAQSQMVGMVPGRLLHEAPEDRKEGFILRIHLIKGDGVFIFPTLLIYRFL
jgi:hypothetical protein